MVGEPATPNLVAITRRAYEQANAQDWDAVLALYGPHSVWDTSPLGLGVYKGPDAIRAFYEEWAGSYDEYEIEAEEIVDLGREVVLVAALQSGRPAGGSGRVQLRYGAVIAYEQGTVMRVTNYTDLDQARAAGERLAAERG